MSAVEFSAVSRALQNSIAQFLDALAPQAHICVAFSGGLDSTVLLHLLATNPLSRNRVYACHVDHRLQSISGQWALHCSAICSGLDIPCTVLSVDVCTDSSKGLEASARAVRYQALLSHLKQPLDVLVTGHHQKDQVETVLLNLMRGSGVKGLSGMAYQHQLPRKEGLVTQYRPLLAIPIRFLESYAQHFQLQWVEDPSNQSLDYNRNYIRHAVLPVLHQKWPSIEDTVSRAAMHLMEGSILLDRLARADLQLGCFTKYYIDLDSYAQLDWIALKNCLRYWCWENHQLQLSTKHYEWLLDALQSGGQSKNNEFSYKLSIGSLKFYKGRLYYLVDNLSPFKMPLKELEQQARIAVCDFDESCPESDQSLIFEVPGTCNGEDVDRIFIRSLQLSNDVAVLNKRRLKRFFQMHEIPVWERAVWPVLERNGEVISVLGCHDCLQRPLTGRVGEKSKVKLYGYLAFIYQSRAHKAKFQ